jgi:glycine dehydrogenase subunit 1
MLETLELSTLDDLFDQIPAEVALQRPLDLPDGVSEMEIVAELTQLARRNRSTEDLICFAGGGAYDHYLPAVVWALVGRAEFATSYTPYQPELSQGVLQTLFEFQSMMCELTGMEVSNASLYDGATALVEAVNMSREGPRSRVIVAGTVDRRLVDTLATYGRGSGYEPEVLGSSDGRTDLPVGSGDDVAAVVVQHPNAFGVLEDVRAITETAHRMGARAIEVFDPMSLGVLAPPGELGVDVAVGEGQALGNPLTYGGPYLGILAARMADVRRMPGRIVGETVDVDGRTGYVLTLQAREQHIRREKATSNICTNQTLMALAATVHLAWLGPDGLAETGRRCAALAAYAFDRLTSLPGVEAMFPGAAFFREFAMGVPRPAQEVRDALIARGFLTGVPVGEDGLLVALTERRTRADVDGFAAALAEVLAA